MSRRVHISIVLDRSGSMDACRADAVAAVNTYMAQVRDDRTLEARLSLVTFDDRSIDTIRDRVPVTRCPELRLEEFEPRGSTPLLDAIGYSASILDCLSDKDERRILAILTDGQENASREYTREKLRAVLERKQRQEGWLVLYMGCGDDARAQAGEIGISRHHAADFSLNALRTTAQVLGVAGRRFMAAEPGAAATRAGGFTPEERSALTACPADLTH